MNRRKLLAMAGAAMGLKVDLRQRPRWQDMACYPETHLEVWKPVTIRSGLNVTRCVWPLPEGWSLEGARQERDVRIAKQIEYELDGHPPFAPDIDCHSFVAKPAGASEDDRQSSEAQTYGGTEEGGASQTTSLEPSESLNPPLSSLTSNQKQQTITTA